MKRSTNLRDGEARFAFADHLKTSRQSQKHALSRFVVSHSVLSLSLSLHLHVLQTLNLIDDEPQFVTS